MNNTEKAKFELAERMIKGKLDLDEVHMMTGLPMEELTKIQKKIEPQIQEAKVLQDLDNQDFNIATVMVDNMDDDDSYDMNY